MIKLRIIGPLHIDNVVVTIYLFRPQSPAPSVSQ
jgi:hypothetical protein